MDLYFSPLACSMATRIALYEAGAAARFLQVDGKTKRVADGSDFLSINPLGLVPALRTDHGEMLTENAAKRIAHLLAQEDDKDVMFRIAVSGGGCSGFQYGFSFDDTRNEDDQLFEQNGVKVVIDTTSLAYLAGAQVDFVEDMVGSSFAIKNPNASSSCSCGNSFAVG